MSYVYYSKQDYQPIALEYDDEASTAKAIQEAWDTGKYQQGDVIGSYAGGIVVVTETAFRYLHGYQHQIVIKGMLEPGAPTPPDIESRPSPAEDQRPLVEMIEYTSGLFEIEAQEVGYNRLGVYVSKPFHIPSNIVDISLKVHHKHPLFDEVGTATSRDTSVEYYVACTEQPSQQDWLPILPQGQQQVHNEVLYVEGTQGAKLRFKASPAGTVGTAGGEIDDTRSVMVYRNGKLMASNTWEIHPDRQHITINRGHFNPGDIYTADYRPDSRDYDPWRVDLIDLGIGPFTTIDTFKRGPDHNGTLHLSKHPYINFDRIGDDDYHPIRVTIYDAEIVGPEDNTYNSALPWHTDTLIETRNITDYATMRRPTITPYSPAEPVHLTFEYNHQHNMLHFDSSFKYVRPDLGQYATGKFKVEYDTLSPPVRFKIILRNTAPQPSVSPLIHEYTLNFSVVR